MACDQFAYLADIVKEAQRAQTFVAGCTREQFLGDEQKQYAVQHALSIIGEAVSHLDPTNRQALSALPLRNIRAMRNRMQHEYWSVEAEILWQVVSGDLAPLVTAIEPLLPTT